MSRNLGQKPTMFHVPQRCNTVICLCGTRGNSPGARGAQNERSVLAEQFNAGGLPPKEKDRVPCRGPSRIIYIYCIMGRWLKRIHIKFDGVQWRNLTQHERNKKSKMKYQKRKKKLLNELDHKVNKALIEWIGS